MRFPRALALAALSLIGCISLADAIILYRTGDPSANTTAPVSDVAGSGWNYEGGFGGFLGTAIAPHFFITAKHIGNQGTVFTYGGVDFHIIANFPDPQSDLVIYQVEETFPTFAPLYSRTDEVGQRTVDVGRGTQRGDTFSLNNAQLGWLWGNGDGVWRWGENVFSDVVHYSVGWDFLYATFDANGLGNECTLSSGDSGGGAFLNDNGVCKLAGINYAVDGPFSKNADGSGAFDAALYDSRGLYLQDGSNWTLVSGSDAVPAGFYPTRISTKLAWICSVIATPQIGQEANFATLTYTKILVDSGMTYSIEQSDDLLTWRTASTIDETLSTSGSTAVVKAKLDATGKTRLFLRLRMTQP